MTLFVLITTVWFSDVRTALHAESFLDYSPTLLITRKSKHLLFIAWDIANNTSISCRALLANIRNLGSCPCPRCEVKKTQIEQIGTVPDDQRRSNHMRNNTTSLRNRIKLCREAIYQRGKGVKSAIVEDFLSPLSFVPTSVRGILSDEFYYLH